MNGETMVMVVALVVEVLLTIAVAYVGVKVNRFDKMRDELKESNRELIRLQFAQLAAEMKNPITELGTIVLGIKERLASGDETFDAQGERAQALEVFVREGHQEIKRWVTERFATKQDFEKLSEQLRKMEIALAKVEARNV